MCIDKFEKALLNKVIKYAKNAREKYMPNVKDEELCDNGAFYYMNGNDGTDFDWECNGRVCEIMQFYKSTEYGLLKVYPHADGYIRGYIYGDEGRGEAIEIEPEYIGEEDAELIKDCLQYNFDDHNIWDSVIEL